MKLGEKLGNLLKNLHKTKEQVKSKPLSFDEPKKHQVPFKTFANDFFVKSAKPIRIVREEMKSPGSSEKIKFKGPGVRFTLELATNREKELILLYPGEIPKSTLDAMLGSKIRYKVEKHAIRVEPNDFWDHTQVHFIELMDGPKEYKGQRIFTGGASGIHDCIHELLNLELEVEIETTEKNVSSRIERD